MNDDLIICTRHRPDDVRACLETVRAQTHVPACTTVVDSSDDEQTARVVEDFRERWPDARALQYMTAEPGVVRQRIHGLAQTRHDIVHFVDDDTLLESGYFEAIIATFEGDASLGGAGGFVTNQPEHRFRRVDAWLGLDAATEGAVLPSGRNVRVYSELSGDLTVDWLPGCAMSYRRAVLDDIRPNAHWGADRNGEDVELSYRVRQQYPLVVTPRARLAHLESGTGRRSVEELTKVEIVSRWHRVRAGTGRYSRRSFWVSAWGQLVWYAIKGAATFSRPRVRIAAATWRGIREIRRSPSA